jgi:polar amino acid transport system substrate-binding protein
VLKKSLIIIFVLFFCQTLHAQVQIPLRIAVPHFLPPFVIEGANHKLSGFDITLMTHLCEDLHRQCIFIPMATDEIIPAITRNEVDLGIGSLTITLDRYNYVGFTIPYMLSESRFLGKKFIDAKKFDLNQFKNKNIGVQRGTIHEQELRILGFKENNVTSFISINSVIDALNNDEINLAMVSNPVAIYWENYSAGTLHPVGKPLNYGLGIGIAATKNNGLLVKELNDAILLFQQTDVYHQLYQMYFGEL